MIGFNTIPKILKDFAVFIDGKRYAGQISEIELPKITVKKEDYRVGYTSVPITMGLEPLECSITMVEQVKDTFLMFGILNNAAGNLITFKGYQEGEGGLLNNDEIEVQMRGVFTDYDPGTIKRGEMPAYKIKVSLHQYIYRINKMPLITIDPYTNTFMVGGVDQLAASKKALGII